MKIALIGFGVVGQGLLEILRDKAAELHAQYTFVPRVVAIATRSKGTLYHPDGLNIAQALAAISSESLAHYPDQAGLIRNWDSARIAAESNAEVLVECSPSNFQTAQPALDLCLAALKSDKHLVLANKGPVALHYTALMDAARQTKRQILFEGTVMAGTPSIALAQRALQGCTINAAAGILNGTTNYMLTQMETGMTYADALAEAQLKGYAEADPTADVDGWDAAGKALILANLLFGKQLSLEQMHVEGIRALTPEHIAAARAEGERWKLLVRITPEGASVAPTRLPISNPLANVAGSTNAITYSTDLLGDVTLIGAGAGRKETGYAILSDLLQIWQNSSVTA